MSIGNPSGPAETLERLRACGVVPVVELATAATAPRLLEALLAGGLAAVEITLRTSAGLEAIGILRDTHPEALVGAGTVRTLEDAEHVLAAGAQFVVSPATYPELIELCRARHVAVLPGACTPTEVDTAVRCGAEVIKFFPAEAMGGIRFLKALAGPLHDVRFVPTGGINAANVAAYLSLPQVVACGGSWMVTPSLLREGRFDEVEALAREAVTIVAEVRRNG